MPAILCVAAHPDDEAFGPAGTIARYVAAGVPVDLLTFTRGQRGTRLPFADTPAALGRLREYELRASARVLGIRELQVLEYVDGRLGEAPLDELVGHILRAIARGRIDTIITFGPLGITRHADHIAAHEATLRALEDAPDARLFYYAVEGEWAEMMKVEGPEAEPTHTIDISGVFETKLAALACHSSQKDAREFFAELIKNPQRCEWFHRARPVYTETGTANDLLA